jgi:CO/xanthine dehydrogenase Mo-binding subunit/CO/xanthine dehydrogenase FAD-binding subunit
VPAHLFGAILRSPHPHAEIRAIDTSRAQRMPGVHAVITMADFAAGARYIHRGAPLSDRPPLADGVVRHVGQEIAAVAADTVAQARAACRAIRVQYRLLPAPMTVREAMREGAPTLHERTTSEPNVAVRWNSAWGDPAAGKRASTVMVSGSFVYPSVSHACMEPNTTLASWHADREVVELWTSTQAPWFIAKEVSQLLGITHDQVICREVAVGGGFGSKSKASEHEVLAAALSRKAGQPVLVALSRAEEFGANKPRHRFETTLRTYADDDGRVRVFDADILVDNGSYNHMGSSVLRVGVITLGSIYHPDGARFDARLVDTATQPGGQFRGYGTPQISLAVESELDEIAELLGIDPIELRLRNLGPPDTTTLCGYKVGTTELGACLNAVREGLDWDSREQRRVPGRGWGVAAGTHGSGAYAYEFANRSDAGIDVHDDGTVTVRFGGADAGTGQRTILAQIAADELGVDLSDVDVISMDTDLTPFELGAWSSRGTHMTGMSVGQAAREVANELKELAAEKLGTSQVQLRDGKAVGGGASVSICDLVRLSERAASGTLSHESSYVLTTTEMLAPGKDTANLSPTYAFAAHGAQVDVDTRTGKVIVSDYVAAHDVGTAINPTMVEGQITGGAVMGLGAAIGEELIREGGTIVNPTYVNYALPRAADFPSVRPVIVESYDRAGPYGAKSVGEMSIVPPGAAVANAVYDAIGVRIRELPITPDKVINAIAFKEGRRRRFHLWRRPSTWWVVLVRAAYPRGLHWLLHRWGTRFGPGVGPRDPEAGPSTRLVRPVSVREACDNVAAGATVVAGATDVLTEEKLHPRPAGVLVTITDIAELHQIRRTEDGGVGIGAAVTLSELAEAMRSGRARGEVEDVEVPELAGLVEAIETIASPQIRNAATVGGNLNQVKRCWFFRNEFPCYKRNGPTSPCYAVLGDHRFQHAAIGAHRCQAVTPSDLATALVAYDAIAVIASGERRRSVAMADFYSGPGESVLKHGELLVEVIIPPAATRRSGVFAKLALSGGDFSVASVAMSVLPPSAGSDPDVRIVIGAVAPTPLRLKRVETECVGRPLTAVSLRSLVDKQLDRLGHPLPRNGWKLDAVAGLCETAAERLGLIA